MKEIEKNKILIYGIVASSIGAVFAMAIFATKVFEEGSYDVASSSEVSVSKTQNISSKSLDSNNNSSSQNSSIDNSTSQKSQIYKDGIYNVSTTYRADHDINTVEFQVEIENDKVKSVAINQKKVKRSSVWYIQDVEDSAQSKWVGKNFDSINSIYVSGATITSRAFNNAIKTIKSSAKN
ncbi:MAG: hypothetical protein Fur0024_5260 [Patescibacteria group bacterium]